MKPVALVGFRYETLRQHLNAPKDAEIWTLNSAWRQPIPRVDRLFEIHDPEHRLNSESSSKEHENWLSQPHMFPIYTLPEKYEEMPASVAYPWDEIVKRFCGHLIIGKEKHKIFTSTFDYMIALALYEGFAPIYIYGFAMDGDDEYAYQREGFAYWSGFANALGVDVIQCKESTLMRSKIYHLGGQMIAKHTVERHKRMFMEHKHDAIADLNKQIGVLEYMESTNNGDVTPKMLANQEQRIKECTSLVDAAGGGVRAISGLLAELNQSVGSE